MIFNWRYDSGSNVVVNWNYIPGVLRLIEILISFYWYRNESYPIQFLNLNCNVAKNDRVRQSCDNQYATKERLLCCVSCANISISYRALRDTITLITNSTWFNHNTIFLHDGNQPSTQAAIACLLIATLWILNAWTVVKEVKYWYWQPQKLQAQLPWSTVGNLRFGPIEKSIMFFVTSACARRTGAASRAFERMHNTLSHRSKT
jgi:hypothetical protein